MFLSSFTVWCIIALVVLGVEMLTTTIYLLAIFAGAVAAAFCSAISLSFDVQLYVAATVIFVVAILCHKLKKNIKKKLGKSTTNLDQGEIVVIKEKKDDLSYIAFYRGANWQVKEENNQDLKIQDKVRIKKIDGITLIVEKI